MHHSVFEWQSFALEFSSHSLIFALHISFFVLVIITIKMSCLLMSNLDPGFSSGFVFKFPGFSLVFLWLYQSFGC
jgi:hypothetical protein